MRIAAWFSCVIFAWPDRFALLPVTVEVPGEDDPAAGSAVGVDGLGDGDGWAEELVIVTQAEMSVEVINLATWQTVGEVGVLHCPLQQTPSETIRHAIRELSSY